MGLSLEASANAEFPHKLWSDSFNKFESGTIDHRIVVLGNECEKIKWAIGRVARLGNCKLTEMYKKQLYSASSTRTELIIRKIRSRPDEDIVKLYWRMQNLNGDQEIPELEEPRRIKGATEEEVPSEEDRDFLLSLNPVAFNYESDGGEAPASEEEPGFFPYVDR
jgi:hypothetical protein